MTEPSTTPTAEVRTATRPAVVEGEPDDSSSSTAQTDAARTNDDAPLSELRANLSAARKAEREANAKLATLERQHMSDQDKAIAEARADATKSVRAELGGKLAAQQFIATAATKQLDVASLLPYLDATKLLDDTGEPDADAISDAVAAIAKLIPAAPEGNGKVAQLTTVRTGAREPAVGADNDWLGARMRGSA